MEEQIKETVQEQIEENIQKESENLSPEKLKEIITNTMNQWYAEKLKPQPKEESIPTETKQVRVRPRGIDF